MRTSRRLAILFGPCILAISMSVANATSLQSAAKLEIHLEKRDLAQTTALSGVTVDVVFPGGNKVVEGTVCDPGSDAEGLLYCSFPCASGGRTWKYKIRYAKIGGFYRTPPRRSFTLLKCSVNPNPVTAVYLHSDVYSELDRQRREKETRLNQIMLTRDPLMEALKIDPNDVAALARSLGELSKSSVDTDVVLEFQLIAADLSALNLELGEHDQANLYQSYNVAAINVMLDQIAQAYQPEPHADVWAFPSLAVSPGSLSTYYANLKSLDAHAATNVENVPAWVTVQTQEDLKLWRGTPLSYNVARQIGDHFKAYVGISGVQ